MAQSLPRISTAVLIQKKGAAKYISAGLLNVYQRGRYNNPFRFAEIMFNGHDFRVCANITFSLISFHQPPIGLLDVKTTQYCRT